MTEQEAQALCGWIPDDQRTPLQRENHENVIAAMPRFGIIGDPRLNDDKEMIGLWECAKVANGGKHFIAFAQKTGSCVGNGLGQAVWYLSAVEVVRLKDAEQVLLPFYLLPYGRSRLYAGMTRPGEGSFGSTAAKAIKEDGILPYNHPGLPQPTISESDGITWGRDVEYSWSDGDAEQTLKLLPLSRKHLVKTAALVQSEEEAWAAVSNYYPLTIASSWGGQMRPSVQGSPACLLNKRVTTWMHQMCVIGRWKHPEFGRLYYILNSWGPQAHGQCPSGAPPGGFWVRADDMAYIVRQRDSFALSQFQGFPAQQFSWDV